MKYVVAIIQPDRLDEHNVDFELAFLGEDGGEFQRHALVLVLGIVRVFGLAGNNDGVVSFLFVLV